jgi:Uma2 family endonuclease
MSDAMRTPEEYRRYTYEDYKAWELREGERFELIDGEAYALAAPSDEHQAISMEISRQMANFLLGKPCKVRPAPYDVRLFYDGDDRDDTVVQPDISVICDEAKRGSEGCRGAPDLVVEILSPSNTGEEWLRKFNLYMEAGVRELWAVSPKYKTVQIFVLENGVYQSRVKEGPDRIVSSVLEGFSLAVKDLFG